MPKPVGCSAEAFSYALLIPVGFSEEEFRMPKPGFSEGDLHMPGLNDEHKVSQSHHLGIRTIFLPH